MRTASARVCNHRLVLASGTRSSCPEPYPPSCPPHSKKHLLHAGGATHVTTPTSTAHRTWPMAPASETFACFCTEGTASLSRMSSHGPWRVRVRPKGATTPCILCLDRNGKCVLLCHDTLERYPHDRNRRSAEAPRQHHAELASPKRSMHLQTELTHPTVLWKASIETAAPFWTSDANRDGTPITLSCSCELQPTLIRRVCAMSSLPSLRRR